MNAIIVRFLFLAFISLCLSSPLSAQGPNVQETNIEPKAAYSTKSYAPLPAGVAFVLEPMERTLLNEQVTDYLKVQLPKAGYLIDRVAARYGLVINAELITPDYREKAPERWQLLHLTFPSRAPARRDYFISLAIYDKQSGLYVWRGEAARVDETIAVDDLRPIMIDALIKAFGKNVAETPLP